MKCDEKFIKSYDGELIYAREYTVDNPKGVIILTTDLKEYSLLYEEFAKSMQEKNYNVFLYDLRAHKNSAKEIFGTYQENFFNDCVRDALFINRFIYKKYGVKIINISMGFGGLIITRMLQFLHEFETINILIGCPYSNIPISDYFWEIYTKLTMVFINKNSEAKFLNNHITNNYQKHFKDKAFISTNKEYIEKISEDRFCNFNLSANILNSVYKAKTTTFNKQNMQKIDSKHKIILMSGEFDAVTNFGRNTKALSKKFTSAKVPNSKIIIRDSRHNLINESNHLIIDNIEKIIGD